MKTASASSLTRREFLRRSAAGAAAASLTLAPALRALADVRKIPLGVQLYSVREECKKDFPGTLKAVAGIGYKGVEFAGYWGKSAADIRKMLDDDGLVACGTHTAYETVQGDELKKTIEFNHTIGNRFLIVPSMTASTKDDWKKRGEEFSAIAEKLKPENMRIGYHSHWHDFKKFDGEASWDIFGANTSPDVILQLDTANATEGGADALAELKKFPGRTRSIHIKAAGGGKEAVIGEDKLDWPAIFAWCESEGGTEWYVLEHETSGNALDAITRSFAALKKFGKA
ncbi:MAG TPA: sugar phosphate isomerase/epimerase [Verrucomicrobiae bacterium]|jgi:sugar phosphate isomerase/epimerase|nr:sugar phosphate isomerase/epimerase [Verrucomicrobiae bacterium]